MRWQWSKLDGLTLGDLYAALALRQQVFVVEQACPYLDADGLDAEAWHLLGWHHGRLVAYLRARPPGSADPIVLSRIVIAEEVRRRGWGRELVALGMRRARETFGAGPIQVSAQAHLEGFYRSLGFEVTGPGYAEDGIPHLPMRAC